MRQRWLIALLAIAASVATAQAQEASLHGHVVDENSLPVRGAKVIVRSPGGFEKTAISNAAGNFEIAGLPPGSYRATVTKPGFFVLQGKPFQLRKGSDEISFTLSHVTEMHESVDVIASEQQINPQQTDEQKTLEQHEILDLPLPKSHDLKTYLPSIPGVLRDNSGNLHVAGGRNQETEYLLDGFEIGDPATGALTTRLNVDAVRSVDVTTGSYGAQYSHGSAGVMALNTQMGDDHLRFGTTNFLPGVSLKQGFELGNWYPRFTLSGPIERGRAWFSDALSLQHTLSIQSGLPKNADTTTQWNGDNLLRGQFNLTPTNILQANFLVNQTGDSNMGLSTLTPISTAWDLRASRYFASLKDQMAFERGLFEFGVAFDKGTNQTLPHGSQPYVLTPFGASGNYFETLHQQTHRWQAMWNLSLLSRQWHGSHNLRFGFNVDDLAFAQQAVRGTTQTEDASGNVSLVTTFTGPAQFRISNQQLGGYVQDTWQPFRSLLLEAGARADWNAIIGRTLVAPRLAGNFVPFADGRAKLTVSWGIYYQPLDLAVLGLGQDQTRVDFTGGANGTQGPYLSRFIVPSSGLQQPRFHTTSVGWQERIGSATFVGVHAILRKEQRGLAYEFQPSPQGFGGNFLLQNNRQDRYHSLEFSVRRSFHNGIEIFGDYMRSQARSNEALDYSLENTTFSPQIAGALPWDAPNRIISYGWTPTPIWKIFLSYFVQYRTGFPYSLLTPSQQLVGQPGALRFPNYLSLDIGIEKRFHFHGHEWAVRLSTINITDHNNPDTFTTIAGSPVQFAGGQHRAFTARLRLVGKK